MDVRKIEAFAKVFEHKSFSKAGKSLYLSQPTISAHVAALEQELGVILFDRIGRTVVPTCAGEILYVHAQRIFDEHMAGIGEPNIEILAVVVQHLTSADGAVAVQIGMELRFDAN